MPSRVIHAKSSLAQVAALALALAPAYALAQVAPSAPPSAAPAPAPSSAAPAPSAGAEAPGMVRLSFPETVDLKVLIDYVGKRLDVNFIYDEQIGNRKITLKAPAAIPSDALMNLLESALKTSNLVISKTEVPRLLRIDQANKLTAIASASDAHLPRTDAGMAVTRVIELKYATPQKVDTLLKPFLSSPNADLTPLPERGLVIVTDYALNLPRLEQLIALIDRPRRDVALRLLPVAHQDAAGLATKVTAVLTGMNKTQGDAGAPAVSVLADERGNQLILIGLQNEVDQAATLAQSLDVSLGLETKVYRLQRTAPDHVDRLLKGLIGEVDAKRLYQSVVDPDASLLIATTTGEIHAKLAALVDSLDQPAQETQSPIRFYKLENARALDVLMTLQSIGSEGLEDLSVDGVKATADERPKSDDASALAIAGPTNATVNNGSASAPEDKKSPRAVQFQGARIMADEPTNTLIVISPPATHAVLEKLIQRLDIRQPQVMVEVTIVSVDTTDDFSLGVEIMRKDDVNNGSMLNFSSFGLSKRNPVGTGSLTLEPGLGFTGALISADVAEVVIRALDSDSRARVLARPSILVNDNATGELKSENEEPYSSTNAASTIATTSFGGFAKAGTNLKITPQISEGDYLKLEFEAELSSFANTRTDETLPPARQTNSLKSLATIPDGYTIVVGGLTREISNETVDRVPILGNIPIIEYAFSNRSINKQQVTLFIFIKPVILRDDKFKHLKILSGDAATRVQLAGDFPASQPLEIR